MGKKFKSEQSFEFTNVSDEQLFTLMMERHQRIEKLLGQTVVLAKEAGDALIEMKSRVEHGEWEKWLEAHWSTAQSTARLYMQIARGWYRLKGRLEEDGSLTIPQARAMLQERKLAHRVEKFSYGPQARTILARAFTDELHLWSNCDAIFLAKYGIGFFLNSLAEEIRPLANVFIPALERYAISESAHPENYREFKETMAREIANSFKDRHDLTPYQREVIWQAVEDASPETQSLVSHLKPDGFVDKRITAADFDEFAA